MLRSLLCVIFLLCWILCYNYARAQGTGEHAKQRPWQGMALLKMIGRSYGVPSLN